MAWSHLSVTKPHLVYILLGAFTTVFMLVSSFVKERMYIGEATVATIFGVIFGPHAANLINPLEWGNVDIVTIEFSRIVLVVQCFAIGVELPKFYMERHWKSVVLLLVPVMTYGWLAVSLVVWWMVPRLSWLESLVVAACFTATDPVLASSVVGKGKFAQRVPKHLRDLLSAESGCNDGMAFPFVYLALYLILYHQSAREVPFHWFCFTILYECVFGAFYGFMVGYLARHGIKWAHEHDMIDRESFLVFYFVVALFCAGSGSILGMDDLLVGFAAGVGFSNDGWFGEKTEESHVSNVIDLLLNLTYFVFLGTIIPWEQFDNPDVGLSAWRLSVLAIFVIVIRRIPVMLALKPLIPDVRNWREAMFAGHFGPIGVGAIFVALLARAELEHGDPVPMSELPPESHPNYALLVLVWPITTFVVISSIIVHGSSVAVFTLGKRINTLTITMSYTTANEDGPSWMNRLPRISSMSRSQAKAMSDTEGEGDLRMPDLPPGALPPVGLPQNFLRRQRDEEAGGGGSRPASRASSLLARRRKKKWDDGIGPGGPVSQSAIVPTRRQTDLSADDSNINSKDRSTPPNRQDTASAAAAAAASSSPLVVGDPEKKPDATPPDTRSPSRSPRPQNAEVYAEGHHHIVVENEDGDVLLSDDSPSDREGALSPQSPDAGPAAAHPRRRRSKSESSSEPFEWTLAGFRKKMGEVYAHEVSKRKDKDGDEQHQKPARAYQFGNTIIVEDEHGEVVKTYDLSAHRQPDEHSGADILSQSLKMMGLGHLTSSRSQAGAAAGPSAGGQMASPTDGPAGQRGESSAAAAGAGAGARSGWASGWTGARRKASDDNLHKRQEEDDDRHIRFKIGGRGQRMTKDDFIREVQKLDSRTRREVVDQSTASQGVKNLAKAVGGSSTPPTPDEPPRGRSTTVATVAAAAGAPPAGAPASASASSSTKHEARSLSRSPGATAEKETAAERRRRLAALRVGGGGGGGDDDETAETPAERRRREAALRGRGGKNDGDESDSDEEEGGRMRVPPRGSKRGIRFADAPAKRQM